MKHTQTQRQETGLASLWQAAINNAALHLENNHPQDAANMWQLAREIGEIESRVDSVFAASFAHADSLNARGAALAASHAALLSALESAQGFCLTVRDDMREIVSEQVQHKAATTCRDIRKALSDARNLSAGTEGGTR